MPTNDRPFIHRIPVKDRDGKVVGEREVVSYRGLLDMAHKEGLRAIRTKLVQAPSKENGETAIVSAQVRTNRGTFMGLGDANPKNVNARIAPHIVRMAETRAEARALRKAVNIGVVALEELGEDLSDDLTYESTVQRPAETRPFVRSTRVPRGEGTGAERRSESDRPTEEQRRYLFRLLADRGVMGDKAGEYVYEQLGVTSVMDASRTAVSALIDRLKATAPGSSTHGGGSPSSTTGNGA